MALARSASAGGLSINTGAANLFGTSQPASAGLLAPQATTTAGTLFGTSTTPATTPATATPTTTTTTTPANNMFGAAAAKPATGGLFGQPATAASAAAAPKPSLFGASTATTAAPAAGGLFGGATTTTTAPASGGLFGGAAATTTTTAPASGGLFGGAAAAAAPKPSLFGASTAAAAPAPAATSGGLFGASTAAAAPATASGGLFGASTAQPAAATSGGLFGPSTTAATTGTSTQQQTQVVPGVRIDLSNLRGTTRFNDLQENLQSTIVAIDSKIQSYIEQKNQVEAFLPAHAESLEAIPGDVKFVARKYDGVSAAMASDLQTIQSLRETVKEDAEHAQLSFKALDNQKLPAQFHTSGLWSGPGKKAGGGGGGGGGGPGGSSGRDGDRERGSLALAESGRTDLINYFSHTGDEIGGQLRKLEANLGEIEVHMYSVQAGLLEQLQRITSSGSGSSAAGGAGMGAGGGGGDGSSADSKVAELAAVLRDFEESILTVASVVGSARESMTGLQLGGFLRR